MQPVDPAPTFRARQRAQHRALLDHAERALRALLHQHFLDPKLQAHAERAAAHVREAVLSVTDPRAARTVDALHNDLARMNRVLTQLGGSGQRP